MGADCASRSALLEVPTTFSYPIFEPCPDTTATFRLRLAVGAGAAQLTLPRAGCVEDFHIPEVRSAGRTKKAPHEGASLARRRRDPGKGRLARILEPDRASVHGVSKGPKKDTNFIEW